MKLTILAAFALVFGVCGAAHAACTGDGCATDGPMAMKPPHAIYPCNGSSCEMLRSRIDNALKDLEIARARAFKADQEQRMNAICATENCAEPTNSSLPGARGQ